jgi:hypothetical protein
MLCAPAAAWGSKGHTIVNRVAARDLAQQGVPAFLSTAQAVFEIGYLGPEMDRLKGSGPAWDADYDPGHYVDLLDDGSIAGAVPFNDLPPAMQAYDDALHGVGTNPYQQGYLPYSILDGWEQLREDFAYWRVDKGDAKALDEQLILRDVGVWGHFIGDGSQPLHVTVHFNGWGDYPNPNGYTQSRATHSSFEDAFVNRYAQEAAVASMVDAKSTLPHPSSLLPQTIVMHEVERYLLATNRTVPQLYAIEKAGGFRDGSKQAVQFVDARLAAGATELRNLVVWAWQDSLNASVGYPAKPVRELLGE